MALRRSSLPLLGAMLALFCLPAPALAQTPPSNDTVATPGGWRTTPYVVTLAGSDAETAVTMEYEHGLNTGIVPSGTQVTISSQGQLDFRTRAVDGDAPPNASTWRTEPLWIDMVDPTDASTATTTAAASGWHLAPTSFEVRAVDITSGVDHVEWSLDGGATQNGPNGTHVPLSANGPHLIRTRAVDVAGNVSDWTDHVIRVDAVAPADTTALPTGWRTASVDVTVKGTDAHSGVDEVAWVVDGGAPTTASPQGQFTISADGSHTVQTLVRDTAGNESGWAQHTVNIDTTAPTDLTDAPDDWVQAAHVEVEATDAVSGVDRVEWQIDGGPWLHGPSGTVVHFTTTGEFQLRTRARDVAGNVSAPQLESVQVDAAAPVNTTTQPAGQVSNPYQVAVTGTDDDAGVASVEWQIDNGSIVSGAPGDPATITGGGQHTLKTRVVDAAGNASAWRTDTITVNALLGDNVMPVDTTTGGSSLWRKTAVTVTVQATDAGSGVDLIEYRIPGFISGETATTATFQVTQEGNNLLETRVTDKAGNRTTWRQQRVKLDLTDPADTIDIPEGWQGSNNFELAATDAQPGSGVDEILYTVNGGPELSGDPGDPVTVGADGTYVIESRVIDNAGRSSAFTTRTLKVDTLDPVNTSAVPGAGWLDAPFEHPLSGTDLHLDELQWRVDGGPIQHGGPVVIEEDGEFDLETQAVDEAGNVSGWRLDTVQIDGTAPENTTSAAPTGWRKTPYTVEVTGDDDAGSGVDYIERTIDGGTVSTDPNVTITGDGVHTLRTRIFDVVGHVSDWREELIKIDTALPSAALACSSAADAWSRLPVSCTVTAEDALAGPGSATLAGADGGTAAVADDAVATVSADGSHTLRLDVLDAAGNAAAAEAVVHIDRTAPVAGLSCAAAGGKYTCRADASDGTSGLAHFGWSLDGGEFAAIDAGGSFTVTKGQVRLRAVDVAGNETVTDPVTLAAIPANVKVRISSVPVYLKGHKDADSMLGALNAVRSASGTVSLDLRPLVVGRGTYRVEIRLKSGKRSKRFNHDYKVGRTGALPRIGTSLSKATAKTTITLTVRKKSGKHWRKYAGTRLVLKK
jgi:Bacterial Ig-like domain